jgi:hypothetical protein
MRLKNHKEKCDDNNNENFNKDSNEENVKNENCNEEIKVDDDGENNGILKGSYRKCLQKNNVTPITLVPCSNPK